MARAIGFSITPEDRLREYGSGFGVIALLLGLLVFLLGSLLEGLDSRLF